jgi:hypothetical protein
MTEPRRRLVRLPPLPPPPDPYQQERLRRLRDRLGSERAALARWMARLRRAFHTVEKKIHAIAYAEREITKLQEGSS